MAGRHVQRIVVGIDFSPMSKQVLRETIHHVGTGGAELHVLFVATSSDVIDQWQLDLKVLIDDVLEHRAKHHTLPPLRIFAHVRSGNPAQALASRPGTPVVFVSGYTEDTLSAALVRIPRAIF